jgi:hypothetical protein
MRDYQEGLNRYIPNHMHDGIINYIEHHLEPGGFLVSMLVGEFDYATRCADSVNRNMIPNYILFFQEYLDKELFGSVEIVNSWLAKREWT